MEGDRTYAAAAAAVVAGVPRRQRSGPGGVGGAGTPSATTPSSRRGELNAFDDGGTPQPRGRRDPARLSPDHPGVQKLKRAAEREVEARWTATIAALAKKTEDAETRARSAVAGLAQRDHAQRVNDANVGAKLVALEAATKAAAARADKLAAASQKLHQQLKSVKQQLKRAKETTKRTKQKQGGRSPAAEPAAIRSARACCRWPRLGL